MNGSQVSSVAGELAGIRTRLGELAASVEDDAARIDVLAELERLRGAVAAAQARVTEAFVVSQEAANRALGLEARAARRGVPEQVGPTVVDDQVSDHGSRSSPPSRAA